MCEFLSAVIGKTKDGKDKWYFLTYNVFRKNILSLGEASYSIEDLWLFFLVNAGCLYFHNDTPSFRDYLFHKALTLHDDTVGGVIRAHAKRWFKINNLTSTAFKTFGRSVRVSLTLIGICFCRF